MDGNAWANKVLDKELLLLPHSRPKVDFQKVLRLDTTSRDFVARSFNSRTKNHDSLAETFSSRVIVRSTCGKSSPKVAIVSVWK